MESEIVGVVEVQVQYRVIVFSAHVGATRKVYSHGLFKTFERAKAEMTRQCEGLAKGGHSDVCKRLAVERVTREIVARGGSD